MSWKTPFHKLGRGENTSVNKSVGMKINKLINTRRKGSPGGPGSPAREILGEFRKLLKHKVQSRKSDQTGFLRKFFIYIHKYPLKLSL